jgi:hypothetical protein
MNEDTAIWYLPDEDGQPAGPFTTGMVLARLQARQCSGTTLCWREGMTEWQPLESVDAFAAEFAKRRAAARARGLRILLAGAVVACLVGGGVAAYLLLVEPAQVREARKAMSAGLYKEAVDTLTPA